MTASGEAVQPELSPSAYLVLAMVRDGVNTGYWIKQYLERAAAYFWSISYGQIYPELRRLEARQLVSGRDVTVNGRRRREFSLTDAGASELSRWLADPVPPAVWIRNESLLRLMLVDWSDAALLRTNLREVRRASRERLDQIRGLEPPLQRGRRIQDLGTRLLRAQIEWCEETEADLAPERD